MKGAETRRIADWEEQVGTGPRIAFRHGSGSRFVSLYVDPPLDPHACCLRREPRRVGK